MARLSEAIDIDNTEPSRGFGTIPAGDYTMQVIESELKDTKSGNGQILSLTWEVIEGPQERSRVWDNINYLHNSPKCQAIGQGHVKSICDAIGITGLLEDSEVLHFKPMICSVGIEAGGDKPGGGKYDDKNVIKRVRSMTATAPAGKTATTPPAGPKPAAPAAAATAPKPATAPARPAAAAPAPGGRPWQKSA
jgi:Protein of unknown function (DUF669)